MSEDWSFAIRPMRPDDIEQALCLSKDEGWNQTEKDWNLLLGNPLNICLVAECNDRIAGTATAIIHGDKVAWIGMVLVDKSLRGHGAGKMLLTGIIDKLKHIESIKLDATPAGEPLYRKLGFKEEYRIFRMTNKSLSDLPAGEINREPLNTDPESLTEVLELDKSIFGADRSYLLKALFHNYPHKSFILKQNLRPDGYVFARDGIRFNYIGPVCAHSAESARVLISKTLRSLNNQLVALDILQDKEETIKWLESIGFVKQRQFLRMYLKSNPHPGIVENQYLIGGPEFG